MHYIQKRILDDLRRVDSAKYVELNTYKVESGHFRYHLQQLVKDGYVESPSRGVYSLTDEGKTHVDKLSSGIKTSQPTPKVITYTLLEDEEYVYLQKKDKEPYRCLLNMVGGKIHAGETGAAASVREVSEKLEYEIGSPKHRGTFEILVRKDDKIYTHVLALIYSVAVMEKPSGTIQVSKRELSHAKDLAPDFAKIYEYISANNSPVFETIKISIS